MRTLTEPELRFFDLLWPELRQRAIPFVVLRNYEALPNAVGNDLDVFVRACDQKSAFAAIRVAAHSSGLAIAKTFKLGYFHAIWLSNLPVPLHIDLYPGAFTWKGIKYLSDEELLAKSTECGTIMVPSPEHECLSLLATSILWGGTFKSRYGARLFSLLNSAERMITLQRLLERTFGTAIQFETEGERLIVASEEVKRFARAGKRFLLARSLKRARFSFPAVVRHWLYEATAMCFPKGKTVAIIGPDGAGKSTLIENLKEDFGRYFGEVQIYHWRPEIMPELGVLLGKRKASPNTPVVNPHSQAPHSTLLSLLRIAYYLLDYWVGYLCRIRRALGKNGLVIFDRYSIDMAIDQRRFRFRLPNVLAKTLAKLAPRPHFYLLLVGDAEEFYRRKPETSVEEVTRCVQEIRNFGTRTANSAMINASRPAADVKTEALAQLRANLLNLKVS